LKQNPALINDAAFVRQHRELADFLEDHPGVREELKENPSAFMNRERGFERSEGPEAKRPDNDTTRAELANFDQFLDSHPNVAKELSKNPSLVDNAGYLSKHPALKDYLEDHPKVREEIKENPQAFMNREHRFERNEGKEAKPHGKRSRPEDRDRH
jgi:hypothetical protein